MQREELVVRFGTLRGRSLRQTTWTDALVGPPQPHPSRSVDRVQVQYLLHGRNANASNVRVTYRCCTSQAMTHKD